jgi:chromosome segregation ATPase
MNAPTLSAAARCMPLLADPDGVRKLIQELSKHKDLCANAMAEARDLNRKFLDGQARLAKDRAEFESNRRAFRNFVGAHIAKLDADEAQLVERETDLSNRMAELDEVHADLTFKTKELNDRQAEHSAAADRLATQKAEHAAQSALLQRKLARFSDIAKLR